MVRRGCWVLLVGASPLLFVACEDSTGGGDPPIVDSGVAIDAGGNADTGSPIDSSVPDTSVLDAGDAGLDADSGPPLPANALKGVQALAGERWSLVVSPTGSLYAWGQYVNPTTGHYQNGGIYANTPVLVQGVSAVKDVAGYGTAVFVLKTDGTVQGWGQINSYAAFGQGKDAMNGGVITQTAPVTVLTAAATPITNVCQIAVTTYGVVMLRSAEVGGTCTAGGARTVWFTGDSISGFEPGLGGPLFARSYAPLDPANGANVTGGTSVDRLSVNSYAASSISMFARLTDGRVFVWGQNLQGPLGIGDQLSRNAPTEAVGWKDATGLSSSGETTVAITPAKTALSAGSAFYALLGNGTQGSTFQTTPGAVSTLTQVSRVSVGSNRALALANGALFSWGTNTNFGALATTPTAITSLDGPFVEASIGTQHALAINAQGGVYSWGANQLGELGCGACMPRANPTLVTVP